MAGALAACSGPRDSVAGERLDLRIGPANPQRYETIRDAKDWKNPYLVIRGEGIEVNASGLPSGSKTVAPTDLQRTLIELPVTAWPYGSVVGVVEIGVRAAGSDDKPIADNLAATLAVLKTLQVTVERWPSA